MYKAFREDFCNEELNYSYIGLLSHKVKIGIVGGGGAALIKAKHFVLNKCNVQILAEKFNEELIKLSVDNMDNLKLMCKKFYKEFLEDKHIIVIALDDETVIREIEEYCRRTYKIYINCSNFRDGMGIIPMEVKGKNIVSCVNTSGGNPKGTRLLAWEIKKTIDEYDDFIGFTTIIRNKSKQFPEHKDRILSIIANNKFKELYETNRCKEFLREHLPHDIVEKILPEENNE